MKMSEKYLDGMLEAMEPVDSPAYQWFVRFKYMPVAAHLEVDAKCFNDH